MVWWVEVSNLVGFQEAKAVAVVVVAFVVEAKAEEGAAASACGGSKGNSRLACGGIIC